MEAGFRNRLWGDPPDDALKAWPEVDSGGMDAYRALQEPKVYRGFGMETRPRYLFWKGQLCRVDFHLKPMTEDERETLIRLISDELGWPSAEGPFHQPAWVIRDEQPGNETQTYLFTVNISRKPGEKYEMIFVVEHTPTHRRAVEHSLSKGK